MMTHSCEYCGKFLRLKKVDRLLSVSYVHGEDIVYMGDDGWECSYTNPTYAHRICWDKDQKKDAMR